MKRIARIVVLIARPGPSVRNQLRVARRCYALEPHQIPEAGDEPAAVLRCEGKIILFIPSLQGALEVDTPHRLRLLVETELRERNAELGTPAAAVAVHRAVPNAVPRIVAPVVVVACAVIARAGGIQPEVVAAAVVEVWIQKDDKDVGLGIHIVPGQPGHDRIRCAVVKPRSHIQRIVVIQHHHLAPLRGLAIFVRLPLRELRGDDAPAPRFV